MQCKFDIPVAPTKDILELQKITVAHNEFDFNGIPNVA